MIKFILVQVSPDLVMFVNITLTGIKQNRQGKTRLSKWYAPYDDDEKVGRQLPVCSAPFSTRSHSYLFAGQVTRRSPPSGCSERSEISVQLRRGGSFLIGTVTLSSVVSIVFSSGTTKSYTVDTPASFSVSASTRMTMSLPIWKQSICLSKS